MPGSTAIERFYTPSGRIEYDRDEWDAKARQRVAEWLAKPPLTSPPILSDLGEILAEADAEMLDAVANGDEIETRAAVRALVTTWRVAVAEGA